MNKIGELIDIKPILKEHSNEPGCATESKICEYLGFKKGEVYVFFNDKENIHHGTLGKIKEDVFNSYSLAAFDKTDDSKDRKGEYWENRGCELYAIINIEMYKYAIRLS